MLYRTLKTVLNLSLNIYFRKRVGKGLENIPVEGPILIVSNHPSGYFDPLCVGSFVPHRLSFLAKSTIFRNRFVTSIFNQLNIIPVYRAQDNSKNMGKNDEMFQACFDKLEKKGVILIFPEGTSKTDRILRSIKTGAARIALGTSRNNDFNLNVTILPVGLNYSNSSRFRSEMSVEFGTPLNTKDYFDQYHKDEVQAVKVLTNDIESSIRNLVVNIEKRDSEELVGKVEKLISNKKDKVQDDVYLTQNIYEAIIYYQNNDKDLFTETKRKIDDYFLNLDEINIKDRSLKSISEINNIWKYILKTLAYIFIGFPLWLFGITHTYLPYWLTRSTVLKLTDRKEFYGAMSVLIGTAYFIMIYAAYLFLSWIAFHSLMITGVYLLLLPVTSIFCIYYARIVRKFYHNIKLSSKMFSSQNVLAQLISDRNDILETIKKIKIDYQRITKESNMTT